ncbi:MAG: hypothetical protein RhofKO_17440 [Rhodothermales bacterium]
MPPRLFTFLDRFGMLLVLALLCGYYAVATLAEQTPRGTDAAEAVARQVAETAPKGATIWIGARTNAEQQQFADALRTLLQTDGYSIAGRTLGEPSDLRDALDRAAAQNLALDALVVSADFERVANNVIARTPAYQNVPVLAPASYRWPTFLLPNNLRNVANQIVVIAIIAIGMTLVIITAGIDLSVGSLIALSAVVAAYMIRGWGGVDAGLGALLGASLLAIALCGLIGFFSGITITRFNVPPFIATLAMMLVASGLAYIIAEGESIYEIPDSFVWLGRGADLLSIPNAVVLMVVLYLIAHLVMTRTTLGRYIYAVGGNMEAARLSGIRVDAVLLFVYTLSGIVAGLGGIIQASQLKSGAPTYGLLYELYVIAAVVVGGTSLAGGEGRISGTLIGALIIGVIQNGMNLTGVESYAQKVVLGFVILGAVLLDMLKKSPRWQRLGQRAAS